MRLVEIEENPWRTARATFLCLMIPASLVVLLSACVHNQHDPVSYAASREYTPDDYEKVMERWTRRAEVYDQFQSLAFVTATLKAPDFRRAYTAAYTKIMDLTPAETGRLWTEESAAAAAYHEVAVVMYTTDRKWNDLELPGRIWKVRLGSPVTGSDEPPADVTYVREISPQMQKLFPHVSPFTKYYLMRFPKKDAAGVEVFPAAGGKTVLTFSSGLGKAELSWEITP